MLRTRVWTMAAGALASALVLSLGGPPSRDDASPSEPAIPVAAGESMAVAGNVPRYWEAGSTAAARPDAQPLTPAAGPEEAEPTQTLVRKLLDALRVHDFAAAKTLLADLDDPQRAVDDLIGLVLHAQDLVTQLMAVQLLASMHGEIATDALRRIAHQPTLALRARTQAVIGLGAQAASPELLEFLSAERELRLAAVRSLGLLGEPATQWPLERALWHEDDAGVRRAGFEALGQLGTPEAVEGLLSFFEEEEPSTEVNRDGILWALGTVSSSEAVPEMLDALARAEDPALRAALVRGLASSADTRAFYVLHDTVEGVETGEMRLQAINGLGLIGDPRALPALRDLAANGDGGERRYARTAIARILEAVSRMDERKPAA